MKLIYILICASIIFLTFSCKKNDDSTNPTETLDQSIQFSNISQNTKWFIGDTVMIAWSTNGLTGVVNLSLFKGENEIAKIISNENCTSSNNEREYVLPINVIPGTDYRIKVNYSSTHLNYSPYFEIKYGKISVIEPNNNSGWYIGEKYNIKWKHSYLGGNVKITLYVWDWSINDYKVSMIIANSTPNDGIFNNFAVPSNLIPSPYEIGITWGSEIEARSDLFEISRRITFSSPTSSSVWNRGGTYEIKWSPSFSPESEISIALAKTDGTAATGFFSGYLSGSQTSYTANIPNWVSTGEWKIEIYCQKSDGSILYGEGESEIFIIQ